MAKTQNSNTRQTSAAPAPDDKSKEINQQTADQTNIANQAPGTPSITPMAATTQPLTEESPTAGEVALDNGYFRVSQPLAVLIVGGGVDVRSLIEALRAEVDVMGLPEGIPLIEELEVSLPVLVQRYADFAKQQQLDLENVLFTVGDPATDPTLKTVNFLRAMQGLGQTFIYPDVLTPEVE